MATPRVSYFVVLVGTIPRGSNALTGCITPAFDFWGFHRRYFSATPRLKRGEKNLWPDKEAETPLHLMMM